MGIYLMDFGSDPYNFRFNNGSLHLNLSWVLKVCGVSPYSFIDANIFLVNKMKFAISG